MTSRSPSMLFIGTYTRRESFVDGKSDGIHVYRFDSARGELVHLETFAGDGTVNPSCLCLGNDARHLYAVNEIARDGGHVSTGGSCRRHFAIDPSGGWLLVAHQDSDDVVAFPTDRESGELGAGVRTGDVATPVCLCFVDG